MLFHVKTTHIIENCPLFHPELRDAARQAAERAPALGRELGVTVHFQVSAAPAHATYYLLEADSYEPVAAFVARISAFPQDFEITPVLPLTDMGRVVLS